MLEHLWRWLRRHDELPTITVPSAAVTDDDAEVWSDHLYLRCLLDDIRVACSETHEATVPRLPAVNSAVLDLTLAELRDDDAWLIPFAVIA